MVGQAPISKPCKHFRLDTHECDCPCAGCIASIWKWLFAAALGNREEQTKYFSKTFFNSPRLRPRPGNGQGLMKLSEGPFSESADKATDNSNTHGNFMLLLELAKQRQLAQWINRVLVVVLKPGEREAGCCHWGKLKGQKGALVRYFVQGLGTDTVI